MIINTSSDIYKLAGYKILHKNTEKIPVKIKEESNDYSVELSQEGIEKSREYNSKENLKRIRDDIENGAYEMTDEMIDKVAQDITEMFI